MEKKVRDMKIRGDCPAVDAEKLIHDLEERNKELRFLHQLTMLGMDVELPLATLLQKVADLIPPAWQYPDDTCARIRVDGLELESAGFRRTEWKQAAPIRSSAGEPGLVEVYYLNEKPACDEGPFLKEERALIDSLALQIARIIESHHVSSALQAANQQLEAGNQQLRASEQQLRAYNQQLESTNQQLAAAEASERHLSAVLRGIRDVNRLIARERDIRVLLTTVCELLVNSRGFAKCSIALWDGASVSAVADAGDENKLRPLRGMLDHNKLPDCMRLAIDSGDSILRHDPVKSCGACPINENYTAERDAVAVRLENQGVVFGAVLVSFPADSRADTMEVELLQELADDLALALRSAAMESDLLQSETRFREAFDCASIGRVLTLPDGRLADVNDALCTMLGYSREELEEKTFAGITHPEDLEESRECVRCLLAGEQKSCRFEKRYLHREGHVVWAEVSTAVFRNERGEPLHLITDILDITERKRGEETLLAANQQLQAFEQQLRAHNQQLVAGNAALELSEQKYRTLVESSLQGVVIALDEPVRLRFANAAMEAITGHAVDELLRLEPAELAALIHPDDRTRFFRNFTRRVGGESVPVVAEYRLLHKSGKTTWVLCHSSRIDYQNEAATLTTFVDITERKVAEETLLAANQQLQASEQQLRAAHLQLLDSEERFRRIYEAMAVGIARVSLDMRIEQANRSYCEMLGYTEEELIGKHLRDITQPELIEENILQQSRLVAGEIEHYRMDKVFIHKSGQTIYGILDACLVRHQDSSPAYCLGSVIDITERKLMEEALARRERQQTTLFQAARAALAGGDFTTVARAIFDCAREATGARSGYVALLSDTGEEKELLFLESGGLPCSVDPSLPMPVRGLRSVAYESGDVVFDNDFMHSKWVEFMPEGHVDLDNVLFAPMIVENKTVGILGLANKPSGFDEEDREVAAAMGQLAAVGLQRSRAEDMTRAERDNLQRVMQTVPTAILVADAKQNIVQMNTAAQDTFGCDELREAGESRCGDIIGCVHRHDSPEGCGLGESCRTCGLNRVVREGLSGKSNENLETRIATQINGKVKEHQVLLSAAPILFDGQDAAILSINDITEMRALHAQVAQSDRLASMGMLAAGVAHEINNPLSYVLYNLESLEEDLPPLIGAVRKLQPQLGLSGEDRGPNTMGKVESVADPALLEDIMVRFKDALGGTHRIRDIARGLGTFSRVERNQRVPVNLRQVIEIALNMASNEIKYRARLVKDYGPIPTVMASEGRLSQVFLNLIINATQAIDEGNVENNEIRVKTWSEDEMVCAEVLDTGRGISAEILDRLFEPFFSTKELGVGSGLGLAISKNIIEGYGGSISVDSKLGQGSAFVVRIPVQGELPSTADDDVAKTQGEKKIRGRILIVDDEAGIRSAMVRMLREHETVQAASGLEAQKLIQADSSFDLILCDMMMPELSGMDFHAWLCEVNPTLAKQFIFITGGAFTPRAREYLSKIDNIQLQKPFDVANFKKIVNDQLMMTKGIGPS